MCYSIKQKVLTAELLYIFLRQETKETTSRINALQKISTFDPLVANNLHTIWYNSNYNSITWKYNIAIDNFYSLKRQFFIQILISYYQNHSFLENMKIIWLKPMLQTPCPQGTNHHTRWYRYLKTTYQWVLLAITDFEDDVWNMILCQHYHSIFPLAK